jgi:hypothetical protein
MRRRIARLTKKQGNDLIDQALRGARRGQAK